MLEPDNNCGCVEEIGPSGFAELTPMTVEKDEIGDVKEDCNYQRNIGERKE